MSDPVGDLQKRFRESAILATTPTDHGLLRQAQERMGHISDKAVMDEYNRLILAKYNPSFLSRLLSWFR